MRVQARTWRESKRPRRSEGPHDALEIEAMAKRRLADEYDAAQLRGEVGKRGDYGAAVNSKRELTPATAADIGLSGKEVHEAREIRDAEETYPGIVRRTLDAAFIGSR